MPRAVLSWMRCSLCGRSPAVHECSDLDVSPLCSYCVAALRELGLCGGKAFAKRQVQRQVDVNEKLLESIRSRGARRRRRSTGV